MNYKIILSVAAKKHYRMKKLSNHSDHKTDLKKVLYKMQNSFDITTQRRIVDVFRQTKKFFVPFEMRKFHLREFLDSPPTNKIIDRSGFMLPLSIGTSLNYKNSFGYIFHDVKCKILPLYLYWYKLGTRVLSQF